MIITDQQLLDQIEAFLAKTQLAPTRFGLEVLGDGGLIKGLREGRSPSLRNVEKIVKYMDGYSNASSAAA